MDKISDFYFLNGKAISTIDINQKLFSSALFYGTGCFETMRYDIDHICRFEDHIRRLYRGLDYLQLPRQLLPGKEFLRQKIIDLINNSGNEGGVAKIRLQCSLIENKGYHKDPEVELLTHIRVNPIQDTGKPLRLFIAKTRVIPSECRPADLKLSNMLHYRTAFREAVKMDYDDALMLTIDEHIAETSTANLFWAIGNSVFTPSKDCSILPGIMRGDTIQAIARSGELNIEEDLYKKDTILNADLVWISNSVVEFRPVISINEVKLKCNENLMEVIISTIQDFNRSRTKT